MKIVLILLINLKCFSSFGPFHFKPISFKTVAKNVYDAGLQSTQNYLTNLIEMNQQKAASLDTADFVRYYGYPCETHEVVTEDKYILSLHHVPHGKNNNHSENCNKPVVFLQHGLFSYSGDWFLSGPDRALGFLLADAGFDVWIGNARGNKHSRDHLTLDPNVDTEFWDFSWHEIGYYDLPAMIDFILEYTKQEKLFYIGHSQGTTVYYVMLSERPEYNNKILAQYSLSPVAFVRHIFGPTLKLLTYFEKVIKFSVDLLRVHELKHDNIIFKYFFHKFCASHLVTDLCEREIFSFVGYNPKEFNHTLMPLILANYPAGCSIKQIKHFGQEVRSGNFEQYDYGYFGNMQHYGERYPPSYKLQNIKAPIYLFCSGNDYVSSLKDVKRLYWSLPDGKKHLWKVQDDLWNHIDYVWGIHAKEQIYDRIMISMSGYLGGDFCSVDLDVN